MSQAITAAPPDSMHTAGLVADGQARAGQRNSTVADGAPCQTRHIPPLATSSAPRRRSQQWPPSLLASSMVPCQRNRNQLPPRIAPLLPSDACVPVNVRVPTPASPCTIATRCRRPAHSLAQHLLCRGVQHVEVLCGGGRPLGPGDVKRERRHGVAATNDFATNDSQKTSHNLHELTSAQSMLAFRRALLAVSCAVMLADQSAVAFLRVPALAGERPSGDDVCGACAASREERDPGDARSRGRDGGRDATIGRAEALWGGRRRAAGPQRRIFPPRDARARGVC
jgi:hypothetical protein